MAKQKKTKKAVDPELVALRRRRVMWFGIVLLALIGCAVGLHSLQQYVETHALASSQPPVVVLKNRPVWMSDLLADQIAAAARPAEAHSPFDHQLLVNIKQKLETDPRISPWIKQVHQVRLVYGQRPGDTLEVDCDYHAPIALVQHGDSYWFVDGDGICLPDPFTKDQLTRIVYGQDGRMNLRIIQGVKQGPPKPGQKWPGDDLAAGLDLVKVLYGKNYTEEILTVDVSNFQGRQEPRDAQLVLLTKYAPPTQLRWGRPIVSKDYFVEISAAQKLDCLRRIYERYGRVDANFAWLDLRFDHVQHPVEAQEAHADGQ